MKNGTKIEIEKARPNGRRRFTPEQQKALLSEAEKPSQSISEVARRYSIAPSMMFAWRRAMSDGANEGLKRGERVVAESELKAAKKRIRQLERALGRQTMENEILKEAVEVAHEKKLISPTAYFKVNDHLKTSGGW